MTYTVAEAERILAEAKAREAAVDPWEDAVTRYMEFADVPRADRHAVKRGLIAALPLAPVQPAPAPSEEDDLRLARDVAADASLWGLWGSPQDVALAGIRAERKRAGGVKAEPEWIDWHGGVCPVPAGTWVEVRFRGGGGDTDDGASYDWDHTAHKQNWEIVRYRILGEQP